MYSIGDFSRMSRLSVKTLRFYHEKGLLIPAAVDEQTGYRYYSDDNLLVARLIVALRDMEFSLSDIATILADREHDVDLVEHLERQKKTLVERLTHYRDLVKKIDEVIRMERQSQEIDQMFTALEVQERTTEPILIAGLRMKGKYHECGDGFSKIAKEVGRYICGKPMLLCYDDEYREEDADFEPCFPIRKEVSVSGLDVRRLPNCRCVTLVHQGPYDTLNRSYSVALGHARQQGYELAVPSREVYLRGPGMLWKGNPKKYLTEIQLPIAE